MPSRPMNKGCSNDHDFVPPTQYKLNRTNNQLPDLSLLESIQRAHLIFLIRLIQVVQKPFSLSSLLIQSLISSYDVLLLLLLLHAVSDTRTRVDQRTPTCGGSGGDGGGGGGGGQRLGAEKEKYM